MFRYPLIPLCCIFACPLIYRLYPAYDFYDGVITGTFLLIGIALFTYALLARSGTHIYVNALDVTVLVFLGFTLLNSIVKHPVNWCSNDNLLLLTSLILYLAFKQQARPQSAFLMISRVILCTGLMVQLYGYLQVIHLLSVINPHYTATGPFFNPNVFCAYLTFNFPLVAYTFLDSKKLLVKVLSSIFCFNVLLFDVLLSSRAAFFGLIFVCIIFVFKIIRTRMVRNAAFSILSIILMSGFVLSVHIKPGSASGRLLIWKISAQILMSNPMTGTGWGSYKSRYNNYQAKYFSTGSYSKQEASLADENYQSFDELLTIGIEEGVIGVILFLGIIFVLLADRGHDKSDYRQLCIKCAVIALMGIGLFSYTLDEPFLFTALITLLDIYSANYKGKKQVSIKSTYVFNVAVYLMAIFLLYGFFYSNAWLKIRRDQHSEATASYINLYSHLKDNPEFLLDYARVSVDQQQTQLAIGLMKQSICLLPSPQVYTALGTLYYHSGQLNNAERCFIRATQITPNRFIPRFMLMNYYLQTKNTKAADSVATFLLQMTVKVPSIATDMIRRSAAGVFVGKAQ